MNRRRPVHAYANVDRPLLKQIAPLIVDEHSIGLEGVANRERIVAPRQRGKDFLVITRRQHQRFASVPNHAQVRTDCPRCNKAVDNVDRLCRLHFLGAQPVGKVAVVAVDIAKRGRLDDQQLDLGHGFRHRAARRPPPCARGYQLWNQLPQLRQLCQLFQGL